jgi:hypothetical protein
MKPCSIVNTALSLRSAQIHTIIRSLLLLILCCRQPIFAQSLTLKGVKGITNVWFNDARLTSFKNPHDIFDFQISPSKKYAFVWHADFPPRKLAIFDLASNKLIKEFVPGAGGELTWSNDDHIVHIFGCGTSCAVAKIYDAAGKTIFRSDKDPNPTETAAFELHPTRRILIFFPTEAFAPGQIALIRTVDGSKSYVGPTNIVCLNWQMNKSAIALTYSTNFQTLDPTSKTTIQIPEKWTK